MNVGGEGFQSTCGPMILVRRLQHPTHMFSGWKRSFKITTEKDRENEIGFGNLLDL